MNLSDNMLVELGEASVAGLGGVRRLDLSYNKLSSVPQLASLGPSLQQLSVSGNMVKQLTQDSLHGLTSLQVWYGLVWYDLVWFGMLRYGMVWYGQAEYPGVPAWPHQPPAFPALVMNHNLNITNKI